MNFDVLWLSTKFSPQNLEELHFLVAQLLGTSKHCESFLCENLFSTNLRRFLLSKSFPLYSSTWSGDMLFNIRDQISPDRAIPNMAAFKIIPFLWFGGHS